jgi:hypothetical protein
MSVESPAHLFSRQLYVIEGDALARIEVEGNAIGPLYVSRARAPTVKLDRVRLEASLNAGRIFAVEIWLGAAVLL